MSSLTASVIKIGNSKGIRLPKVILDQYNIKEEVEIEAKENMLIIRPKQNIRKNWDKAFKNMNQNKDDELIIEDTVTTDWEDSKWRW